MVIRMDHLVGVLSTVQEHDFFKFIYILEIQFTKVLMRRIS